MIKFIFKIFKFIFTLLVATIIFTYIFSLKNNMSFESTISYFKTIVSNILDINNSGDIPTNSDININTSSNNNYYYEQLDDTAKIIYTALENNIDNLKKENYIIDFSTHFNNLLNESVGEYKLNKSFQSALDAFFFDHPELFYLDLSKFSLNTKCISIGSIKTYTAEITPSNNKNYLHSAFKSELEVNRAIIQVENAKNSIIDTVKNETNLYNKLKTVHDILVNSITYDSSLSKENIYNIYGALVEKEAVCEGYAKSFKYLSDCLDIECILVIGVAGDSPNKTETHMWNYVKLDGAWYGVDVTWDDPIIIGGNSKNNIRHTYFLKGFHTFISSHDSSGKISGTGMLFTLPTLAGENYR